MEKNLNEKDIIKSNGQKLSHEAVFLSTSKKAEKISTALYMVTDLIDPTDPIRHRMRQCSIELIAETRAMSAAFSGDIYFSIARAINKAWEIVSLVEVASSVGFISDMNARILKSVFIELISALRDKQRRESFTDIEDLKIGESLADQITLSKSLFEVKDEPEVKRQIESKPKSQAGQKPVSFKRQEEVIKDNLNTDDTPKENMSVAPASYSHRKFSEYIAKPKSSDRKEKIIEVIRQKGEVNVNDVITSFPDVSSKTIQRELTSMVEEGVLKREGEKRWSKYSLS